MKHWRIFPHDADRIAQLEQSARVSPVVAQLLLARGINDPQTARQFLDVRWSGLREPNLLPGLSDAADFVFQAAQAGRRIVIYGDYDADGITGTSILVSCLTRLKANVGYYVPNRLDEGYGLSNEALEKLKDRGAEVVISVDCGIASVGPAARAKELGIDLVITDHHEFADQLPDARGIIHPRLPGHSYPFGGLCGAGVALKLAWALCQRASQADRVSPAWKDFLVSAVGIAAIGTVADVVPLVDENRILVRHGLNSILKKPPLGLRALLEVTELNKKSHLTAEDIGFTIGPRLNAAGRLGQAQLGVELLTTNDPARARSLAEYIHELNKSRDSLERKVLTAARKQATEEFDPVSDPALVLAGQDWHAGVIGIVAGRLAERFYRPVIVISLDAMGNKPATGSCRTAGGLHLHQALYACRDHLLTHGGHAAAAGLRIDPQNIDAFRADFCEYAAGEIPTDKRTAEIHIDAEAALSQLNWPTVRQIEQLAPFGQSNPRPVLCASGVKLAGPPKKMGGGDRHMTVRLKQHSKTLRAVAFGQGEWADELAQIDGDLDIAYRPVISEFNGFEKIELHLVDWKPARQPARVSD